jgi:site-specific DNA recombinase
VTTAVTYARLSKVEYRKQTVESVEAQIAENLAWAAEHHVEVIASFQDNLTASRFSTKDRPGFLQMMRVIRDEQPDMVIVTEQSRLDRQLWNILELIELARATTFKKIGSSAVSVGPLKLVRAAVGTGRRGPAWRAR